MKRVIKHLIVIIKYDTMSYRNMTREVYYGARYK